MTNNPNELTVENSVVILIDHQPWVAFSVHSIDPGLMMNNVAALAQASRDLGVPTVLTTVGAKGSILVDPIFKESRFSRRSRTASTSTSSATAQVASLQNHMKTRRRAWFRPVLSLSVCGLC